MRKHKEKKLGGKGRKLRVEGAHPGAHVKKTSKNKAKRHSRRKRA